MIEQLLAGQIVKNLVLQGLGAVTLIDSKPAKIQAPFFVCLFVSSFSTSK